MSCRYFVAAIAVVSVACGGPASSTKPAPPAAAAPEWHYEGAEGPEHWGKLSAAFATCGEGRNQSPIDLANAQSATTEELRAHFPLADLRVAHHEHVADGINNGHTIQINYPDSETLNVGGVAYQLAQYHFHGPSEHTVEGKHFPMEMHLVHKSAGDQLAVVGVLIAEGGHNAAFDPVWANLPAQKGVETHYPKVKVDVDALLPAGRTSYRYDGSLTTPPCSEGVSWIVMASPIELSTEQIAAFTHVIKDNSRPVQNLNGRTILTDAVSVVAADR